MRSSRTRGNQKEERRRDETGGRRAGRVSASLRTLLIGNIIQGTFPPFAVSATQQPVF